MFGKLRIASGALVAEERELYRAAFCAGCHALHDLCGRPASLLTNYDQTVLALVLAGLGGAVPVEGRACTALPLRTVLVQPLGDAAAALLAAANVAAVRAKLADDVDDGDRPLLKRGVLRLLRGPGAAARAALQRLGFPLSLFDELPATQRAVERSAPGSIDTLAGPSAELTGQLFAHAALAVARPELAPALQRFGAALGAFVYALDAWQDLDDDVRLGRCNAWIAAGERQPAAIAAHLEALLGAATDARHELPLGAHGAVVDALLTTLRQRVRGVRSAAVPAGSRDRRQAGDCDCACGDCCCEHVTCCDGGGSASAPALQSCDCGCPCIDLWCCCDPQDRRRTVRRVRRERKRGGDVATVDLKPLVGASGEALTDLLPRGRVVVHGLTFDAEAAAGSIGRGMRVVVTGVEGGRLVVDRPKR